MLALLLGIAQLPAETLVRCKFDRLPPMLLTFREKGSTLKIGTEKPVPLAVGSSLSTAEYGAQEFTFSLRLPASVTVSAPGDDPKTYFGTCRSTLPH